MIEIISKRYVTSNVGSVIEINCSFKGELNLVMVRYSIPDWRNELL
jgi:hypothetical protein